MGNPDQDWPSTRQVMPSVGCLLMAMLAFVLFAALVFVLLLGVG